jgi:hypothetical protein
MHKKDTGTANHKTEEEVGEKDLAQPVIAADPEEWHRFSKVRPCSGG